MQRQRGSIANKTNGIVSALAEIYNRAAYMPEMCEAMAKWDTRPIAILKQSEPEEQQAG
jgi:hypothetical protein